MEKIGRKKIFAQGEASNADHNQSKHPLPSCKQDVGEYEPLLSCWQAIDGRVRLIISRDGKLLGASQGASRLLAQNDAIARTGYFTLACMPSFGKQLQKLLKAKVGVVETVALPMSSGDGHYIISVIGISVAAVAIAIQEADDNFIPTYADLEAVFGLTHCEMLVVVRLMRGYCAQHIADDLKVSVHTVRAHLRHCYDKLGVSSREELWKRLAPYRLN